MQHKGKMFQSTHPRGVRHQFGFKRFNLYMFQSTHPRGVRLKLSCEALRFFPFQSTHPRGVRRDITICIRTYRLCFNPRTHVGCDRISIRLLRRTKLVSIHAPTWGATFDDDDSTAKREFQSTHPRGVRQVVGSIPWEICGFNPRTHVGCDRLSSLYKSYCKVSIHAPTWGATLYRSMYCVRASSFNPRTHVGCDICQ